MTGKRRIRVLIRRGDQPAYGFDFGREPVRLSKVERILAEAVRDTAHNITRGWDHEFTQRDYPRGTALCSGGVRAVVWAG